MHAPREPDPSIFAEPPDDQPHAPTDGHARRNARYGLWLFTAYVVLYGGFILLAAFRHDLMDRPAMGVNLAIAYGMILIAAALVLAMLYMLLCRDRRGPLRREMR
jgi:uncharacterized membrane protein (DUF485 family)